MLVANERRTGRVWSPALVDADICAGSGQYCFCKTPAHCHPRHHMRVSNWWKLLGLRLALSYMVKGDHQLKTGHARNLWRGIKYLLRKKRGAPREPDHDMALVEEILKGEKRDPELLVNRTG